MPTKSICKKFGFIESLSLSIPEEQVILKHSIYHQSLIIQNYKEKSRSD
jgi:hypothetical protein